MNAAGSFDPHKILGVGPDPTTAELRSAWKRLSWRWHPDRNRNDASADARMAEINRAYEQLLAVRRARRAAAAARTSAGATATRPAPVVRPPSLSSVARRWLLRRPVAGTLLMFVVGFVAMGNIAAVVADGRGQIIVAAVVGGVGAVAIVVAALRWPFRR